MDTDSVPQITPEAAENFLDYYGSLIARKGIGSIALAAVLVGIAVTCALVVLCNSIPDPPETK